MTAVIVSMSVLLIQSHTGHQGNAQGQCKNGPDHPLAARVFVHLRNQVGAGNIEKATRGHGYEYMLQAEIGVGQKHEYGPRNRHQSTQEIEKERALGRKARVH